MLIKWNFSHELSDDFSRLWVNLVNLILAVVSDKERLVKLHESEIVSSGLTWELTTSSRHHTFILGAVMIVQVVIVALRVSQFQHELSAVPKLSSFADLTSSVAWNCSVFNRWFVLHPLWNFERQENFFFLWIVSHGFLGESDATVFQIIKGVLTWDKWRSATRVHLRRNWYLLWFWLFFWYLSWWLFFNWSNLSRRLLLNWLWRWSHGTWLDLVWHGGSMDHGGGCHVHHCVSNVVNNYLLFCLLWGRAQTVTVCHLILFYFKFIS